MITDCTDFPGDRRGRSVDQAWEETLDQFRGQYEAEHGDEDWKAAMAFARKRLVERFGDEAQAWLDRKDEDLRVEMASRADYQPSGMTSIDTVTTADGNTVTAAGYADRMTNVFRNSELASRGMFAGFPNVPEGRVDASRALDVLREFYSMHDHGPCRVESRGYDWIWTRIIEVCPELSADGAQAEFLIDPKEGWDYFVVYGSDGVQMVDCSRKPVSYYIPTPNSFFERIRGEVDGSRAC